MRIFNRFLSAVLVVFMLLTFAACNGAGDSSNSGNGKIVMRYGDITLTEGEYKYIASYVKDAVVSNQQNYLYQYSGTVYSESDILAMPIDEERTIADYIKDYSIEFAQQMMIIEKICADSNINITEQTDLDEISNYVGDIEYAYGGKDLFEISLVRMGFTRSGIERFQRFYTLYDLLYEARYGENGTAKVSAESVNSYFKDNYFKYDGVLYSYSNTGEDDKPLFEYTDDEVTEYFNNNYVKVRHILYKTVDSKLSPLSDDKIKEIKATANAAFTEISSGNKTFDDYIKDNEDSNSEYVFTYGEMVEPFEKASFEMSVGDVRLVETEYGFHIIEKLDKTDADLNGTVGEDGKTKGDIKESVKTAMGVAKIREEAVDTLSKLQSGELKEYPKESDDKPYYIAMEASFVDKTDSNYKALVDIISELEYGVYTEKEFPSDATYILRKISFTEKDITSEKYTEIEEKLAVESYADYVQSFYDSIEITKEYFDSFDIVTLPLLEEEFYVE